MTEGKKERKTKTVVICLATKIHTRKIHFRVNCFFTFIFDDFDIFDLFDLFERLFFNVGNMRQQ